MSLQRATLAALLFAAAWPAAAGADVGIGPRFTLVRGTTGTDTGADRYTGGVLRARMSPRTAIELALDWRTVINASLTERTRNLPFQGSLLLYPVRSGISPYLLGGIGWYSQRVETLDGANRVLASTTSRTFGYHAGFGGELRAGRHAAIHLDYRYKFVRAGDETTADPTGTSTGAGIPIVSSLSDKLHLSRSGSMWTGGLTLYF
jgi:opacity protein-like surface antigen